MNHFDEFASFVRSQRWMSQSFGDILIEKFQTGQADAYERGQVSYRLKKNIPEFTLSNLPKKYVTELKNILRAKVRDDGPFQRSPIIDAIKRTRELTHTGLLDAKRYVERLQESL